MDTSAPNHHPNCNSKSELQTSWIILIVGILFIFAPAFNFLLSLWIDQIHEWYLPTTWIKWLPKMVKAELFWQALFPFIGINILLRHRWSWALAILILAIITGRSLMTAVIQPVLISRPMDSSQFLFIASSAGILIILIFFRYPYLDRRESIWGTKFKRHPIKISTFCMIHENFIPLSTLNISRNGFLASLERAWTFNPQEIGTINLENNYNLDFQIIRVSEGPIFAGKFYFTNSFEQKKFLAWLDDKILALKNQSSLITKDPLD